MTSIGIIPGTDRGREVPDVVDRQHGIRLVVIPLILCAAWLLETFLLEGNGHLFSRADPGGLLSYTVIACILTGMLVPVFVIRRSFITGDVNMFQIGFRTPVRTLSACLGTAIAGYVAVILRNPFGPDRVAFGSAFLLLLPTAIAAVMICWVLTGTHIQAYVRPGGSRVSIPVGVVSTALVFTLTSLVHGNSVSARPGISWFLAGGIILAVFYFSVRDVYATAIAASGISVFLLAGDISPAYLSGPGTETILSALLSAGVLAGIHWYLFRNYTTVLVPESGR
ncbi:MAG TPA: hypothetical protein VMT44_02060 [Methanoregula sp.]|nr:hypothetical protein [Methanoregula sp.]